MYSIWWEAWRCSLVVQSAKPCCRGPTNSFWLLADDQRMSRLRKLDQAWTVISFYQNEIESFYSSHEVHIHGDMIDLDFIAVTGNDLVDALCPVHNVFKVRTSSCNPAWIAESNRSYGELSAKMRWRFQQCKRCTGSVMICHAQVALASDGLELLQLSTKVRILEHLAMTPSRNLQKALLRSVNQLCSQNLRRLKSYSSRDCVQVFLSPLCKEGTVVDWW